ncbi:hypothetical protein LSH36_32g23048 [Paralvinella palmiformis]|uniref:Acylglycerol kinase, mitochondrial n=1 Tax=Paralvinella palmiformis TaxID=53620 RepID=A0AAD9K8Q0_9ANNE|nr:hypothetical protein LSH36_32g23048 [Paralvinella palmiformis]
MAFIVKFVKTIRNNWKKSVFLSGVAAYGFHYSKGIYEDSVIRKAYCEEAKIYGNQPLQTGERARKITVFLNPAAKKGFTEYEGQAKKYMDVLEDTDAIVVAGGDGTIAEASFSKIPIGVIPLGHTNTMAKYLYKKDKSDAKWMLDAALSVVKGATCHADVMKITDEENRTVFAVNSFEWGAFKEAENRAKKYWYFGPLKRHWTYLMSTTSRWPPIIQGHFSYVNYCSGCSNCHKPPPKQQWKWWHIFLSPKVEVPQKDYSKIQNAECGTEHEEDFSSIELTAHINQLSEPNKKTDQGILLSIGPSSVTKLEFVKEGWHRLKEDPSKNWRDTKDLEQFRLLPKGEQSHPFYIIDNEQYEIMPVTVELLRDKISLFYITSP